MSIVMVVMMRVMPCEIISYMFMGKDSGKEVAHCRKKQQASHKHPFHRRKYSNKAINRRL
jgi:hypothetical protein